MGTLELMNGGAAGSTTLRNRRKSSPRVQDMRQVCCNTRISVVSPSDISTCSTDNQNMKDFNTSSQESLVSDDSRCCCGYEFHTAEPVPASQVRVQTLLGGLVAHTTSHGIPHINVARGVIKKSLWTIITLIMVAALIGNLYLIISTYIKFKVDIIIQMQHQRELAFPAITLCNMNPVRSDMLGSVPSVNNLIYGDLVNASLEGTPILDSVYYPDRKYPRASFIKEEKLAEILADLNNTYQFGIGHKPIDMILDCQYSGFACYYQDFEPFYNPMLGNCFVFNSGWKNTTVRVSLKTGRRYGLKLILNIEQDYYLENYVDSSGIRVVVHPQSRMPFPQDEGIVISPGLLTSVGLRQLSVQRKGNQYGNCTATADIAPDYYTKNISRNVFEEVYDVRYSSNACYKTCYQRYLLERCGCGDAQYPLEGVAFGGLAYSPCNSSVIEEDDCKYLTNLEFNSGSLKCDGCVLPCTEITYQPEISSVQWPSDVYESNILQQYINLSNIDATNYKRNLLKVEIYYEEFNYENIEERPSYTAGQFASDIGGVLGLWLGWSIMTVFEFIEFSVDLLILGIMRALPKRKPKKPPLSDPSSRSTGKNGGIPGFDKSHPGGGNNNNLQDNGQVLEEDMDENPYLALKFV